MVARESAVAARPVWRPATAPRDSLPPPPIGRGSEPEVGLADPRVLEKIPGRARLHDPARLEDVAAMRVLQSDLHVLLHEEHGGPFAVDARDELEQAVDDDGSEPEGELVDQEEPGASHQAPA